MAENFERRICFVLRRQILEDWLWQSLTISKRTATQLNDWKNAAGFAARANAVYCIQDLSERKASKTTESPFLRKADEESLSANVASYRIGCSGNLNEKNDT